MSCVQRPLHTSFHVYSRAASLHSLLLIKAAAESCLKTVIFNSSSRPFRWPLEAYPTNRAPFSQTQTSSSTLQYVLTARVSLPCEHRSVDDLQNPFSQCLHHMQQYSGVMSIHLL